jgi:hypothetical protein
MRRSTNSGLLPGTTRSQRFSAVAKQSPRTLGYRCEICPLNRHYVWSGRRDSNPRPSPWQCDGIRPGRSLESVEQAVVRRFVRPVRRVRSCPVAIVYRVQGVYQLIAPAESEMVVHAPLSLSSGATSCTPSQTPRNRHRSRTAPIGYPSSARRAVSDGAIRASLRARSHEPGTPHPDRARRRRAR